MWLKTLVIHMPSKLWLEFKLNGVENGMNHDFMWSEFYLKGFRVLHTLH